MSRLRTKKDLDQEEIELFKYMLEYGYKYKELELAFNISKTTIYSLKKDLNIIRLNVNREKEGLYFCPRCHQLKLKEEFYKSKRNRYGITDYCKICEKTIVKESKRSKIEKLNNPVKEKTKKEVNMGEFKICKSCGLEKPIDSFPWEKKYEKLYQYCKQCANQKSKKYREKYASEHGYYR